MRSGASEDEAQYAVYGTSRDAAAACLTAEPSIDDLIDATTSTHLSFRAAFTGWYEFLSLGLPGAAMLFVEWASYECAAIIAGLDSTTTLAAHTIIANGQTIAASLLPAQPSSGISS